MALATDLPIYREAYEILIKITRITQNFPRGYRQGLARDMCLNAQIVVNLIFKANCTSNKLPVFDELREYMQVLQLQLRLSKDLRLISAGQFGDTVSGLDRVGKQLSGWIKYVKNRI
jgi:hypothetical protein